MRQVITKPQALTIFMLTFSSLVQSNKQKAVTAIVSHEGKFYVDLSYDACKKAGYRPSSSSIHISQDCIRIEKFKIDRISDQYDRSYDHDPEKYYAGVIIYDSGRFKYSRRFYPGQTF